MRKVISFVLAVCLALSISVAVSAADIDESGGSATTPVSLTTTNGGIGGDVSDVAPTKLNVTIPTALPIAMADNGTVVTATDCKIVNHSYGAVRVSNVTIKAANGWRLTKFGDKSILAGEKVDSNKLGFALSIGGGHQVETDGSDTNTQHLISAPISGCYMTGSGDDVDCVAEIDYSAIITPLSGILKDATVANVVIVVEWDTEG